MILTKGGGQRSPPVLRGAKRFLQLRIDHVGSPEPKEQSKAGKRQPGRVRKEPEKSGPVQPGAWRPVDGGGDKYQEDDDADRDVDNGAIRRAFPGCHTLMWQLLSLHPFSR